jgi:H+/Cl- antiporter ClcA
MKKWSIIIAAALVATWLLVDMVHEFFANETIQYFSSEPHRLLYVAAIGIVGGFAALGFARLSPRAQRRVRIFAWGAAASILTTFVGYFAFRLASLSPLVVESGGSAWVVLALLLFSAIAAYLWFEFCRTLKTGVTQ